MPKFFIKGNQINENKVYLVGEDVKHIANVLRKQSGDEINICNIDTSENFLCQINNIGKEQIECNIIKSVESDAEPRTEITVFQGLPKAEKMELIIQKCTELGAKKFVPVQMERCIVKLDSKQELKKNERWQKISETAAKQSGRDIIPIVENTISFKNLLNLIQSYDIVIVAYENEKNISLKDILKEAETNTNLKIGIVIGPEGGITDKEIEELIDFNAKIITLGNRILRTETAGLAMVANILYELEEV